MEADPSGHEEGASAPGAQSPPLPRWVLSPFFPFVTLTFLVGIG